MAKNIILQILGVLIVASGWIVGLSMMLWALFWQPIVNIHRLRISEQPTQLIIFECIVVCIVGEILIYVTTVVGSNIIEKCNEQISELRGEKWEKS